MGEEKKSMKLKISVMAGKSIFSQAGFLSPLRKSSIFLILPL